MVHTGGTFVYFQPALEWRCWCTEQGHCHQGVLRVRVCIITSQKGSGLKYFPGLCKYFPGGIRAERPGDRQHARHAAEYHPDQRRAAVRRARHQLPPQSPNMGAGMAQKLFVCTHSIKYIRSFIACSKWSIHDMTA